MDSGITLALIIAKVTPKSKNLSLEDIDMKKTIITLALVAAAGLAFISTNAFAWNNWGCGGYGTMNNGNHMMNGGYGLRHGGYGMMHGGGYHMMGGRYGMMTDSRNNFDNEAYQSFQKETAAIRSSMAADQAELNAIMAGSNPDPKRARALAESISAKQNQLAEAASKNNIQPDDDGFYCDRW